jgi:hypothetical protein
MRLSSWTSPRRDRREQVAFSLCWMPDSAATHSECHPSTSFLHGCLISTDSPLGRLRQGWIQRGTLAPFTHICTSITLAQPWSRQFTDLWSGTLPLTGTRVNGLSFFSWSSGLDYFSLPFFLVGRCQISASSLSFYQTGPILVLLCQALIVLFYNSTLRALI